MGDASLLIHASIVSQSGERVDGCNVSLHLVNEKYASQPVRVRSDWRIDFVVAPGRRDYYVAVTCPSGLIGRSGEFTYPQNVEVVDLGNIIVR